MQLFVEMEKNEPERGILQMMMMTMTTMVIVKPNP